MLTREQKILRKNGLGGSDIGAICGVSKYRNGLDVYLDKLRPIEEDEDVMTDPQLIGSLAEPLVAQIYTHKTGKQLTVQEEAIWHPTHKFAFANIDRWVEEDPRYVLEIKTAGGFGGKEWGESGSDYIPDTYLMQCAWYAGICDVEKVDIAVLIGGFDFRTYTYQRNRDLENRLFEIGHNFWYNHVQKEIPPEGFFIESVTDNGQSIAADQEIESIVEEIRTLEQDKKGNEEQINELRGKLKEYMGENALLTDSYGNPLVRYKQNKESNYLNTDKLKKEYPEAYNACLEKKPGNRPLVLLKNV